MAVVQCLMCQSRGPLVTLAGGSLRGVAVFGEVTCIPGKLETMVRFPRTSQSNMRFKMYDLIIPTVFLLSVFGPLLNISK